MYASLVLLPYSHWPLPHLIDTLLSSFRHYLCFSVPFCITFTHTHTHTHTHTSRLFVVARPNTFWLIQFFCKELSKKSLSVIRCVCVCEIGRASCRERV